MLAEHQHFAVVGGPHPEGGYVYIALYASQIEALDFVAEGDLTIKRTFSDNANHPKRHLNW